MCVCMCVYFMKQATTAAARWARLGMRVARWRGRPPRPGRLCVCGLLGLLGASVLLHRTFHPDYLLPSTRLRPVQLHDFFWLDWVAGDYFQPGPRLLSPLPAFLLQPSRGCKDSSFLVALVLSPLQDVATRLLIRQTWARAVEDDRWPRARMPVFVEVYFVLGLDSNHSSSHVTALKADLEAEARVYDDLIVGDFADTYRNLSLKTLTGLNWARQRCPRTEFVMKVDQDTLVDFPRLTDFLLHHRYELRNAIIGKLQFNSKRLDTGKWKVLPSEYPLSLYPTFAGGPCYLLSTDVVAGLVNVSQYLPTCPMEDVFVTGILAKALGVRRFYLQQLQLWKVASLCVLLEDKFKVSMTGLSQDDLRKVWSILKAGKCSSGVEEGGGGEEESVS